MQFYSSRTSNKRDISTPKDENQNPTTLSVCSLRLKFNLLLRYFYIVELIPEIIFPKYLYCLIDLGESWWQLCVVRFGFMCVI